MQRAMLMRKLISSSSGCGSCGYHLESVQVLLLLLSCVVIVGAEWWPTFHYDWWRIKKKNDK